MVTDYLNTIIPRREKNKPEQHPCFQRTAPQEGSDCCHHLGKRFCDFLHSPCAQTLVCPRCHLLRSCCPPLSSARSLYRPVLQALVKQNISSRQQISGIHRRYGTISPPQDRLVYRTSLLNCHLSLNAHSASFPKEKSVTKS